MTFCFFSGLLTSHKIFPTFACKYNLLKKIAWLVWVRGMPTCSYSVSCLLCFFIRLCNTWTRWLKVFNKINVEEQLEKKEKETKASKSTTSCKFRSDKYYKGTNTAMLQTTPITKAAALQAAVRSFIHTHICKSPFHHSVYSWHSPKQCLSGL